MARRSDHTREELKELVCKTAKQIISEHGLQALTTRKVAAQIGYSPGSIYNVYDTLDALISDVNRETISGLLAKFVAIGENDAPTLSLSGLVQAYLEYQSENPNLWAANMQHAARKNIKQPEGYIVELDKLLRTVEELLSRVLPDLDSLEVRRAVRVLWLSLQGLSAESRDAKYLKELGETPASLAEHLVVHYVRGLNSPGNAQ